VTYQPGDRVEYTAAPVFDQQAALPTAIRARLRHPITLAAVTFPVTIGASHQSGVCLQ
jgi:hypothetical protein